MRDGQWYCMTIAEVCESKQFILKSVFHQVIINILVSSCFYFFFHAWVLAEAFQSITELKQLGAKIHHMSTSQSRQ